MPKLSQLRSPEGVRVRVQIFPTDPALANDVARIWRLLVADRLDDETFRRDLEERLRRWYPNLSVQGQSDLASMTQEEEVWYLFRDGRIRPGSPVKDRFYGAMASARSTQQELETTMREAQATAERFATRRTRRATSSTTSGA